jgi:hypothetical protein
MKLCSYRAALKHCKDWQLLKQQATDTIFTVTTKEQARSTCSSLQRALLHCSSDGDAQTAVTSKTSITKTFLEL